MPEFDTIVKDGTIVDGTRLPRFQGDVGIKDGRIAAVGTLRTSDATQVLDASGLVVAPGFVDTHTHYDAQIQWDPYCTGSGWHGVTTVVIGNCGFGFAPVRPESRDRAMLMMSRNEQIPYETMKAGMLWDWVTFPEFLDSVDRMPKGVNVTSYVPVSPLLVWVMGLDDAKSGRPPTEAETLEMQRLLDEGLAAGAGGWSVQRLGARSNQADYDGTPMPTDVMGDDIMFALGDVLRDRGMGTIELAEADLPEPDDNGQMDISEIFALQQRFLDFEEELARRSGRPVIHNIVVPVDGFPAAHQSRLQWLEDCNRRGVRVIGQGNTIRNIVIFNLRNWTFFDSGPAWFEAWTAPPERTLELLRDPVHRQKIRDQESHLVLEAMGGSFEKVKVWSVGDRPDLAKRYVGRALGDIGAEAGKRAIDVMLDLNVDTNLEVEFRANSFGGEDKASLGEIARSPYVIPGISDGGAHTKFMVGASYPTELLSWLCRDEGEISLEEAHWHLSYLPAQVFGLKDRGLIREGAAADLVIYDLENLARVPEAEYEVAYDFPAGEWRRIQRASGYRWILVNGEATFEDGECTKETPGRLLRHPVG